MAEQLCWLDSLVRATTAFRSLADMTDAMLTGYVPTIYTDTRRKRILRRMLQSDGFRVWPNN